MTPRERQDAFNRTAADFPAHRTLHALVEAQARRAPGAPALVSDAGTLTFAELEARANRLARHLRRRGVRPEVRVGLLLERGPAQVVAMLAVLKAGGAYVPLDPAHPAARLAAMVADAGAGVVLTQQSLRETLPLPASVSVVSVDGDAAVIAAEPPRALEPAADPANLAYVIFTSGSTGVPKGIAVQHRGVVNNLADWNRAHGIGPGDRSLLVSSLGFDISVFETVGVLAAGGSVVAPSPQAAHDPARWAALMRRHGVTVWNSATALLGLLADHLDAHPADAPPTLRLAFVGGDWVPLALPGRLRVHLPGLRVVALGGVTEVSIYSVAWPVGDVDPAWRSIPYGRPMANQRAYVLDPALDPLPVGEAGEMYLGGEGVTRGYAGRPAFTAERFLPDPFGVRPGARMYRTGDRARWIELQSAGVREGESAVVEFLGRLDAQVKIRGNRVEPGEVEAALRRHPGVARCAVAPRAAAGGEARLVAWVVGSAPAAELREHLRRTLPEYMVPAAIVAMDALPLSPNGKVDRRALPDPDAAPEAAFEAPAGPVEEVLAAMWARAFDEHRLSAAAAPAVGRVGAHDDFFALGGDSVLATRLIAQVHDGFGVELTFRAVLALPTLRAMAGEIERRLYADILAMSEDQAERLAALNPTAGGGPR